MPALLCLLRERRRGALAGGSRDRRKDHDPAADRDLARHRECRGRSCPAAAEPSAAWSAATGATAASEVVGDANGSCSPGGVATLPSVVGLPAVCRGEDVTRRLLERRACSACRGLRRRRGRRNGRRVPLQAPRRSTTSRLDDLRIFGSSSASIDDEQHAEAGDDVDLPPSLRRLLLRGDLRRPSRRRRRHQPAGGRGRWTCRSASTATTGGGAGR